MPSRQTRAQRRAGPPPPDVDLSSDDEVTFKTSLVAESTVAANDSVSTVAAGDLEGDVSTLAGSDDDEAPESVGLADARQEAEALLRDLADSRRRRDDSRKQRDRDLQERNREQKLDKQRRLEMELSQELMDELAEELAEEQTAASGPSGGKRRTDQPAARPKKKRFKYPTPAATGALDFIPLVEAESTEFKAAPLPASALPAVVNPELLGLRERLLYSARIPRTSSRGLQQIRHKQKVSGKYGRR